MHEYVTGFISDLPRPRSHRLCITHNVTVLPTASGRAYEYEQKQWHTRGLPASVGEGIHYHEIRLHPGVRRSLGTVWMRSDIHSVKRCVSFVVLI
jgi:hypothetical protein